MLEQFSNALASAQAHALAMHPERSCGLIVKGEYIACENVADDPATHMSGNCGCRLCTFQIAEEVYRAYEADVNMIVHSVADGLYGPSRADMERQMLTNKPWAVIPIGVTGDVRTPVIVGGEIPPLLGRKFIHGVADCYAFIRDAFALGRHELARQGIPGWPFDPIILPAFPRNEGWWLQGENMYLDNFANAGFFIVSDEPRPGDMFVSDILNLHNVHGGIMVGNDMIAHHLPGRLSRLEPAALWKKKANVWVRQIGKSFSDDKLTTKENAWKFLR